MTLSTPSTISRASSAVRAVQASGSDSHAMGAKIGASCSVRPPSAAQSHGLSDAPSRATVIGVWAFTGALVTAGLLVGSTTASTEGG
jgi:hypothetical protein